MIVLSNTNAQTLTPGESLIFDNTVIQSGCAEHHADNSASVLMLKPGMYEIHFTGNVAGIEDESTLRLGIRVDSNTLSETTMMKTVCRKEYYSNVAAATIVRCETKGKDIGVTNIGAAPIVIAPHSSIFVKRVA